MKKTLSALTIALALFFLPLMARGAGVVTAIELQNPSKVEDAEFLRVFRPKAGQPYDPAEVRRSLRLLSVTTGVKRVEVLTEEDAHGVKIRVVVTPEPLIRAVILKGVTHFDPLKVVAEMRTRVDEPVHLPKVGEDLGDLLKRYREEGYASATGAISEEPLPDGHWVNLVIDVKEGEPLRVDSLGNLGDAARIGEEVYLSKLGLDVGRVASVSKLREGLKAAQEYCFGEGYPEARIVDADFRSGGKDTLLNAPLILGKRTKIEFKGVSEFEKSALRERLRQEFGQPFDEDLYARFRFIIVEDMKARGFINAAVAHLAEESSEERKVVFTVDKGLKVKLSKVEFIGNKVLSREQFLEVMESTSFSLFGDDSFSQEALNDDLGRIQQLYVTNGMLDTGAALKELVVSDNGEATALIEINEGILYRYGKITYETDASIDQARAARIAELKEGQAADPALLEKTRIRLLTELSRLGYVEAFVDRKTTFNKENGQVDVAFKVHGGKAMTFGALVVSGNARTRANVVLRELTFRPGDPWSQAEVINSKQKIFRLGFFQQVDIIPYGEPRENGALDVLVKVRETDAGHLDYGLGYGTEEGIKTFAELGHANIYGRGRSTSLRMDVAGYDRTFTLNYVEPWILGFPFSLRMSLVAQHQELETYDLDSLALVSSVEYDFSKYLKATLIHKLEDDRLSDITVQDFVGNKNFLASTLSPLLVLDTRDDPFNPRSGFLNSIQYDWASQAIGSDLEYSKVTASTSGYFSLGRYTLALLARGGAAYYYGLDETLPLNKRFFLGGRSTVRGFGKDEVGPKAADGSPLGGDLMLNLKAELKATVYKGFGLALFWDAGQVWLRDFEKPKFSDLRQAVGPGLRYNTPVGPLSLDVGYKLDRQTGETAYEWHFTIGNVF